MGAGGSGAYALRTHRRAEPLRVARRPPSPPRQGYPRARRSVGRCLSPSLLPLRRRQHRAAGILEHLPALCAFTAPSVVSYLRLVPHFWSAGFGCLGERNRETAIRIPPTVELSGGDPARQINLEFRAPDAAACPHLVLAVLVLAGLRGLQDELPEPTLVEEDPTGLDEEERRRLGISGLFLARWTKPSEPSRRTRSSGPGSRPTSGTAISA